MNEQKLLSVCIPTFNRAEFLRYNLSSITDQFDADPSLLNLVEIVISDNASADGTKEMVANFVEKYANITYNRNDTNIGFDRNLNKAIRLAKGKYCLTLGDDDALFFGSLSVLVKKISAANVPYYLVGHVGYSRDMQHAYANEHDAGVAARQRNPPIGQPPRAERDGERIDRVVLFLQCTEAQKCHDHACDLALVGVSVGSKALLHLQRGELHKWKRLSRCVHDNDTASLCNVNCSFLILGEKNFFNGDDGGRIFPY